MEIFTFSIATFALDLVSMSFSKIEKLEKRIKDLESK